MVNTLSEIQNRTTPIDDISTSRGGISISIRLFSPGNTGMIVNLCHRTRAITANDMAGVVSLGNQYAVSSIVIITDAKFNFLPALVFPNAWVCWLPTTTHLIEEGNRFALGYDYFDPNYGESRPFYELARRCGYQDEGDFYSYE
ncbi:hypothetical protein [Pantoea agglomerans]|uniref:hypothetical protein n=1 Tax=Enterobacter agglomerans TaxID=549 RepID=UPI0021657F12|nr:hypothetical protein [Pantoea agglomerans]UVV74324.1 hypothetical protein NYF24_08265 [Pantoea agglomerans]